MALTDTKIRQAKPKKRQFKLFDEKGLFLIVAPSGGKWWRFKYRYNGKEKLLSLGTYPEVSLKRAREKRDDLRSLVADGIDPGSERKKQKNARTRGTFEILAHEWLGNQKNSLKKDTLDLALQRFEKWVFPFIGSQSVKEINPPEILSLLRRIEDAGRHETAHRVRQRIGQVFRYAIGVGEADRDPTADLKGVLKATPTKHRSAITNPKEVSGLLLAIQSYSGQPSTRAALLLTPLTFLRPGELRKATWDEIDLKGGVWRIPGERMKMGRDHIVPLSRQAKKILKELQPITGHKEYVFESLRPDRPLSENTINFALRGLGYSGDQITAHGFRAMASTLLHELGWAPEVIELQLAHAQKNRVAAAYNRSERLQDRKKMMQAWADHLDKLRGKNG